MSILDDIKSRLPFTRDFGREEEEYYDEEEAADEPTYRPSSDSYNDSYGESAREEQHSMGVLGQTHRGEAESVAVYTRSGKPVGEVDRHASTFNPPARSIDQHRPGAYDTPSSYAERGRAQGAPAPAPDRRVGAVVNSVPQLPAYILRPESYDDVETVVRRVRTKQPVALVFVNVKTDVAKRVLDFSYGFACGLGASVKEVGDRVFIVLPQGCEVKESDLAKLRSEGFLKR